MFFNENCRRARQYCHQGSFSADPQSVSQQNYDVFKRLFHVLQKSVERVGGQL